MSRQYDFLTDFVTDTPANIPNSRLPVVTAAAVDVQAPAITLKQRLAKSDPTPKVTKRAGAAADTTTDNAVKVASNPPPPRPEKLKSTARLATKATSVADGKSRLKMETFDLMDEQQVMLKMSTALLSPVSSNATPAKAQALAQAAAVWRALNAKPEELAADAQKLQATTAELQSVKDNALKTRTSLQARLRVAEEKEFSNPLVYGLLGLLALTLAGLAWLLLQVRKGTQPSYAWLREKSAPAYIDPLIAEPLTEDHQMSEPEMAEVPDMPETLDAPMVFTIPANKSIVSGNNNPLWPANAASSIKTDSPAPLVITPTEAFMLPITVESDAAVQARADMRQQLRGHADPVVLSRPKPNGYTTPAESLNIDLDFSKISPAEPKPSQIDTHSGNDAGKEASSQGQAKKARHNGSLPKSVHQLHASAVPPLVTDLKSNLIDFDIFANPPEATRPSRFPG